MTRNFLHMSLLAVGLLLVTNCSEIPENNDPVIGVWSNLEITTSEEGRSSVREEWYFNDAYLGRYYRYESGVITAQTDFGWKQENGIYTIDYMGLEIVDDQASIAGEIGSQILETPAGEILAHRE
ncbi:hypothetical protein SAMN04490243_2650 [Robiginitalea myxolifaciens]|uniref:Lipocalin-like domain-containing protein n=2 Tax=Robiginitalea myxolifaciens TaxID=400055 RepID=A0A1I6HEV0_9FLAO|nr:hypothetical protein SAMN04490243_2650 [Robiginitalea myxolifaciens]